MKAFKKEKQISVKVSQSLLDRIEEYRNYFMVPKGKSQAIRELIDDSIQNFFHGQDWENENEKNLNN